MTGVTQWFVFGVEGQLGRALRSLLAARAQEEVQGVGSEVDICDPAASERALRAAGPLEVVVNAAAFTRVDDCERERARARAVNAEAPGHLAGLARSLGARFVHVSTDYVFDGEGRTPYPEEAPTEPRSEYGRSKLAGERAVQRADPDALVVRTSWLYGQGANFVATMLRLARAYEAGEGGGLRVVDDQRGRPTYARDLAEGIVALVAAGAVGMFHLANAGEATWWDFAREALNRAGYAQVPIERIKTEAMPRPAPRPAYSVLDCSRAAALGVRLRDWREALAAYLEDRASDAPNS